MLIDCDTCQVRGTNCADCVISLLMRTPGRDTDLTEAEAAAFEALAGGGILPPLRLVPVERGRLPVGRRSQPGTRAG